MVVFFPPASSLFSAYVMFAEQAAPAKTLPEPYRSVALMALLGIALLGMLMIVATLLGGHWVRRWGSRTRRPAVPPDRHLPRKNKSVAPKIPGEDLNDGDTFGTDETLVS